VHPDIPGALLEDGRHGPPQVALNDAGTTVTNGSTKANVIIKRNISFFDNATGTAPLEEQPAHFWWPVAHLFWASGISTHRIEQRFAAVDGEHFNGLGQHTQCLFDRKAASSTFSGGTAS
jgi:alpha-D-xyloside xylohydrolase